MTSLAGTILLVEDNDDDAELTLLAFAQARISNPLVRVHDGVEALDWLFCRGEHTGRAGAPPPAIILLDLKLPRMGGIEVLGAIRADSRTRHIPVVVLTSSAEDADRLAAYEQRANSYIQKPVDHERFVAAARQIGLYWMLLNQPPPATDA